MALDTDSASEVYAQTFADYRKRFHRRPLLLLDQFDDYQAKPAHRDRFRPDNTRVWRAADDIANENAFWRVLRHCLAEKALSVIVACRDDAVKGLDSLRFNPGIPPYDLPRLEPGQVRSIIHRLLNRSPEKPVAIVNPEGGWTTLRDRLVEELEARGQVLPQQLKLIFGGLRTLRWLTPRAYARVGQLAGLEAAFVEGALRRATHTAALRDDQAVLLMMIALVDQARQTPDKGPPLATTELAERAKLSDEVAERVLRQLEVDEVLRKVGDTEKQGTVWQLDHAYLAQPILRIERNRDRLRRALALWARSYAEARWQDKWRNLLPLDGQLVLLVSRLRG